MVWQTRITRSDGKLAAIVTQTQLVTAKELGAWRKRFDSWLDQGVDVYVYCKHEDEGKGPAYARTILAKK